MREATADAPGRVNLIGEHTDYHQGFVLPAIIPQRTRVRATLRTDRRVRETAAALSAGDLGRAGALFAESHASMRDDYETSTPEIDTLVELGQGDPDVYGARLTGGGFGGSVVMLARRQMGTAVTRRILTAYHARTNQTGSVLLPCNESTRSTA